MPLTKLQKDILLLVASFFFAALIAGTGAAHAVLAWAGDISILANFIAGLLFTSVFTTAPAIIVLGQLAQEKSIIDVALIGGLGAVIGDYVLFSFVRDHLVKDGRELMKGKSAKRIKNFFEKAHLRRALPLLGALIIASPFPDELGLALLGTAALRTPQFLAISFCMNTLGIILIGLVARAF